jgi:hypothetical protein
MNDAAKGTVTATDAETAVTTVRQTSRLRRDNAGRTDATRRRQNVFRMHVPLMAVVANRLTTDQLRNQR